MRELASRIGGGEMDECVIAEVRHLILLGRGPALLQDLQNEGTKALGSAGSVDRTMRIFETIKLMDVDLALILMAHLYGDASRLYMHHVCDAIELHFQNSRSFAASVYIKYFLDDQRQPFFLEEAEDWIELLEKY